ncbi:MAG: hypothetical protein ACRDGA_12190 [Bacteroidota bacterium]
MRPFIMQSVTGSDVVAKGGCYLCLRDRTNDHGPLIDTGEIIDMEGRLIICSTCLEAMVSLLDYLSPKQSRQLGQKVRALQAELQVARMQKGKAEKALIALREHDATVGA